MLRSPIVLPLSELSTPSLPIPVLIHYFINLINAIVFTGLIEFLATDSGPSDIWDLAIPISDSIRICLGRARAGSGQRIWKQSLRPSPSIAVS